MNADFLSRITEIQSRIGDIRSRFHGGGQEFGQVMNQVERQAQPQAAAPEAVSAAGLGTGPYAPAIADSASRHGVDPALVKAVMTAESGGNPQARSPVGAIGLMQLMPGTARSLGVNPYDPVANIEGGAKYLGELTQRFGIVDGVAAYNAGPGAVERFGGVPPYKETQAYVKRVLSLYNASKEH